MARMTLLWENAAIKVMTRQAIANRNMVKFCLNRCWAQLAEDQQALGHRLRMATYIEATVSLRELALLFVRHLLPSPPDPRRGSGADRLVVRLFFLSCVRPLLFQSLRGFLSCWTALYGLRKFLCLNGHPYN
jgi:hypothetical protein